MTALVATLGEDNGTWEHVRRVIAGDDWEKVYLIAPLEIKDAVRAEGTLVTWIGIDRKQPLPLLTQTIQMALDGKIFGDAGINMVSGSGKTNMATLAALLKIGAGIRLIALTKEGVREL